MRKTSEFVVLVLALAAAATMAEPHDDLEERLRNLSPEKREALFNRVRSQAPVKELTKELTIPEALNVRNISRECRKHKILEELWIVNRDAKALDEEVGKAKDERELMPLCLRGLALRERAFAIQRNLSMASTAQLQELQEWSRSALYQAGFLDSKELKRLCEQVVTSLGLQGPILEGQKAELRRVLKELAQAAEKNFIAARDE